MTTERPSSGIVTAPRADGILVDGRRSGTWEGQCGVYVGSDTVSLDEV